MKLLAFQQYMLGNILYFVVIIGTEDQCSTSGVFTEHLYDRIYSYKVKQRNINILYCIPTIPKLQCIFIHILLS